MPFRIVVILCAAIAAAIAGASYPFIGLLALEVLTFARPQDDRPNVEALHIPLIVVISIAVGMIPRIATYGPGLAAGLKRIWIMLILYALLFASAVDNGWTPLSQNRLYDFGTIVFLCLVMFAIINSAKQLEYYILGLLACGAYVAQRVIRDPGNIFEQIGYEHFERAALARGSGNFGNSNFLALLMVLSALMALALLAYYSKWWQRVALFALVAGCGYVFFRANSRGASIGLGVGLICLWFMSKSKLKSSVLALGLAVAIAIAAPASYWMRLQTVLTYQEDASATQRLELWNTAFELAEKNPVLGIGPDNFWYYAPNTQHDAYLQVASEAGVPALLFFIAWLISGLWGALKARRSSSPDSAQTQYLWAASNGIFCCLVAIVVQGFTTGFAFREFVYGYVVFAFITLRLAQKVNESQELTPFPEHSKPLVFAPSNEPTRLQRA
jgi:putative inorganic carbon (hco3(-)) transporter